MRRLGPTQARGSAGVRAARAGAGKRAREAWWRAGDRLVALGSAQVAQSAGRRWNRRSGAGSPSGRNCARLQAAAQMWASSNGAQVRAHGWSYGAGRPRATEGSAWESQLATAALRASFPMASCDDAQARVRGETRWWSTQATEVVAQMRTGKPRARVQQ
jgi:hypothetical protein